MRSKMLKIAHALTGHSRGLTAAALLTFIALSAAAKQGGKYDVINLVSDLPRVALLQDTNLVNAWGLAFSASSPFWVSDNGTGKATLYAVTNDASGTPHVAK